MIIDFFVDVLVACMSVWVILGTMCLGAYVIAMFISIIKEIRKR